MAIKRTTSPQESDYFYGAWNLEDDYYYGDEWDLGSLGGEGRGDLAPVPLGKRSIPVLTSVPVLPSVVPKIRLSRPPQDNAPFVGPVQSPYPTNDQGGVSQVPVIHGDGAGRYHKQPDGRWYDQQLNIYLKTIPKAPAPAPVPSQVPTQAPAPEEERTEVDLGDLIGQLATTYISTKYAPQLQPVSAPTYGTGGMDGAIAAQPAIGIPFYDIVPEGELAPGGAVFCPPRKRRRRRRRLATVSDIKDIAALKSIMGPAMLKTWIATHSR